MPTLLKLCSAAMPSIAGLGVGIIGIGSYLPPRRVTNQDIENFVDTTAEWISSHTGIHERRYASAETCTSDLATKAASDALSHAKVSANDIGLVVLGTSTPVINSGNA